MQCKYLGAHKRYNSILLQCTVLPQHHVLKHEYVPITHMKSCTVGGKVVREGGRQANPVGQSVEVLQYFSPMYI